MSDGDCQLLIPRAPFCPSSCGGSAVCVEDGVCQPYPTACSVGTVHVKGVKTVSGETELTIDPIANAYQPKAAVKLPFPAFAEGDRIRVQASGGDLEPFTLEVRGIAPLALSAEEFHLASDQPMAVTWTPAEEGDTSRIQLKLDISHHGGSKGMIVCDVEDRGELQLGAALDTALIDLGFAGFPTLILSRVAATSASLHAGRVDLTIESKVERSAAINGLSSCTGNADCPRGESCQSDLTCG
jgi:hypothetical protein